MEANHLYHLSPLDGRYRRYSQALAPIFSEAGLIKARIQVEISWLMFIAKHPQLSKLLPAINLKDLEPLPALYENFDQAALTRIKEIEQVTRHDVKAVELYIGEQLSQNPATQPLVPWVHFACTSEDINNLAYALMWQQGLNDIILPQYEKISQILANHAEQWHDTAMPGHTHGQTASPTTRAECLCLSP